MDARLGYALGERTKWKSRVVRLPWKMTQCRLPLSDMLHLCTNSDWLGKPLEIREIDHSFDLP